MATPRALDGLGPEEESLPASVESTKGKTEIKQEEQANVVAPPNREEASSSPRRRTLGVSPEMEATMALLLGAIN